MVVAERQSLTARQKLVDRSCPEHFEAIENMSNYLSIMNLLFHSISQVLAEKCGLTTLQYRVLLRLLSAPDGQLRTTELAQNLCVGASTISAAMPKLVAERLVARVEDPLDMRVVSLRLTDKGVTEIDRADCCVGEFLQTYWRNLTREQLDAALASSTNAAAIHHAQRMENGRCRLDTAFFDAVMISRTLTAAKLADFGLRTPEFRIMVALRILGAGSTATQLARYLFLKSSDVTSPIKALESRGFVSKERNDDNRRVKSLSLTNEGWEYLEMLLPHVLDALLETCHSDEEAVEIHLSAARNVVSLERGASLFA